jgi:hypothetical protein
MAKHLLRCAFISKIRTQRFQKNKIGNKKIHARMRGSCDHPNPNPHPYQYKYIYIYYVYGYG